MSQFHVAMSCRNFMSQCHVAISCRNVMSKFHVAMSCRNIAMSCRNVMSQCRYIMSQLRHAGTKITKWDSILTSILTIVTCHPFDFDPFTSIKTQVFVNFTVNFPGNVRIIPFEPFKTTIECNIEGHKLVLIDSH